MADKEARTFTTDEVEANRTRMQGNGMSQSELDAQHDPDKARSVDQYDFDGENYAENEDAGPPMGHAQTGRDHTRRPDRTEAMRGQGPKTREANRKIAENRPGYGGTS